MINKCTYPVNYMIFTGLLYFLLKIETRRQFQFKLNTKKFVKNVNKYLNLETELQKIHHPDTMEYFYQKFSVSNLKKLRKQMVQRLIEMKKLTDSRLSGYYLIAIDGTGNLTFKKKHCDKCLIRRTVNGDLRYYHPVLDAKLVTGNGLALSIGSEFIENERKIKQEMKEEEKQDCELNAGYRLLKKLKNDFSQLNMCILGDSLYANQQMMQICKDNKWKYIITFKKGSIPGVYEEFKSIIRFHKKNNKNLSNKKVNQRFHWINEIDHEGHKVNVIECKETNLKNNKEKTFCFITNFNVTEENVDKLANQGGRQRWRIENEGFNMQKNGGYNLEHQHSSHNTAIKNYYLLMQVAHIINQLVEKSNLLKQHQKYFGAIKNLSERFIAELIMLEFDFETINGYSNYYITIDKTIPDTG